jgi:hypothetical protein
VPSFAYWMYINQEIDRQGVFTTLLRKLYLCYYRVFFYQTKLAADFVGEGGMAGCWQYIEYRRTRTY